MIYRHFTLPLFFILCLTIITSCQDAQIAEPEVRLETRDKTIEPLSSKANGLQLFKQMKCVACHQKNETSTGPSMRLIRSVYENKEAELILFLQGEASPLIDTLNYDSMLSSIQLVKALPFNSQADLAKYVLSSDN